LRPGPIVVCSSCGEQVRRSQSWQRFSLLRHLGTPGGGRQKTLAGRGEEIYFCTPCARREDYRARGIGQSSSLFGDKR
jgi:hypothetical protein